MGHTTETKYKPYEHIPGLNIGGWFDAGDFDIQTGSHNTVIGYLVSAWEDLKLNHDETMYSATKTFTGIAVGFAVQEGLLHIDDKVTSFFPDLLPEKISPELAKLTVAHLLTMSVGHARDGCRTANRR